jgi:hypothetical protein
MATATRTLRQGSDGCSATRNRRPDRTRSNDQGEFPPFRLDTHRAWGHTHPLKTSGGIACPSSRGHVRAQDAGDWPISRHCLWQPPSFCPPAVAPGSRPPHTRHPPRTRRPPRSRRHPAPHPFHRRLRAQRPSVIRPRLSSVPHRAAAFGQPERGLRQHPTASDQVRRTTRNLGRKRYVDRRQQVAWQWS